MDLVQWLVFKDLFKLLFPKMLTLLRKFLINKNIKDVKYLF